MLDMAHARDRMVEYQIVRRGIADRLVLQAMRRVPRERFVPRNMQDHAYEDSPLPIGNGQTISQPYIVAWMTEAAAITPGDRVLEVGAGSGYGAAVLSLMTEAVFSIERHEVLANGARERLRKLGYGNIRLRIGDGTQGWPEEAQFNAILVTAGGPEIPASLRHQLAIGGHLVMPVGGTQRAQSLIKLTRLSETEFSQTELGDVAFVPLIGKHGWDS